jgi:hypothetical protein
VIFLLTAGVRYGDGDVLGEVCRVDVLNVPCRAGGAPECGAGPQRINILYI